MIDSFHFFIGAVAALPCLPHPHNSMWASSSTAFPAFALHGLGTSQQFAFVHYLSFLLNDSISGVLCFDDAVHTRSLRFSLEICWN